MRPHLFYACFDLLHYSPRWQKTSVRQLVPHEVGNEAGTAASLAFSRQPAEVLQTSGVQALIQGAKSRDCLGRKHASPPTSLAASVRRRGAVGDVSQLRDLVDALLHAAAPLLSSESTLQGPKISRKVN